MPELTPPRRGRRPEWRLYNWNFGPIPWTRFDWWRFKRACYARGRPAFTVVRELLASYVKEYEQELPEQERFY